MMQDWIAYRNSLMKRVNDYSKDSPDVLKGLMTIDNAVTKTGKLEKKTHELIALAVAVTTRCDGCIAIHANNAKTHGATREEISEALGVAISLNAGAALTYSARAIEAYDQFPES